MKRRHPDEHEVLRKRLRLIIQGSTTIEEAVQHLLDLTVRGVERAEDRALGFTGEPDELYDAFGLDYDRPYLTDRIAAKKSELMPDGAAEQFIRAIIKEPSILMRKPNLWTRFRRWARNEDRIRFENHIVDSRERPEDDEYDQS